ncbi:hypothetical protein AURDEDRAFT_114331 [Auricularia subglabra TFB-10046 SS5]|nr:hypothetical protein AURDEDRAFT_114331 [Auricularia subglabra TFB-10046 SS5]
MLQAPEPYTPVFQPAGYAYKIALPSRPQPGQTPWPTHLPPVVHAPLANATNRQRQSSTYAPSSSSSAAPRGAQLTRSATLPSYYPSSTAWTHGLNPLLTSGALLWTLRLPPSYIKLRLSHLSTPGPLTYTHRAQPASAPPTATLTVVVPLPGAPLRVTGGPTLGALLDALYDALHAPAAHAEWAAANQQAAARAYRVRCGTDAQQLAKGVRRVDLLGEGAAFAGLVRGDAPGVWVLRVVAL